MSTRDEYVRKMQATLEEWNKEIDMLAAKAGEVTADVKNEYTELIDSLKVKQATARLKIKEFQQTGETAWEDLKTGVDQAWSSMRETIDLIKSRFK